MCLYVYLMWIYVQAYIFYMRVYIYFKYNNFHITCILMRIHMCLCTHVRIHCLCGHACVRRMQILLFYLFYNNLCQPLYMFTLVPEIHGWKCAIRVVIRVLRHGLSVGLFYCFNYTVCFIVMYFVRNDEINDWKLFSLVTRVATTVMSPRSGTRILDQSHDPIWAIWLAEVSKFHQYHDRISFQAHVPRIYDSYSFISQYNICKFHRWSAVNHAKNIFSYDYLEHWIFVFISNQQITVFHMSDTISELIILVLIAHIPGLLINCIIFNLTMVK